MNTDAADNLVRMIFIYLFFTFIFGLSLNDLIRPFLNQTFNLTISEKGIVINDYLKFKTTIISKNNVKGFSTSENIHRNCKFRKIIIYMTDDTKLELVQFSYFNFKKIEHVLNDYHYEYFGFEKAKSGKWWEVF